MSALKVLFVEDVDDDAQLVLLALERGGFATTSLRVDTKEAMIAALEAQTWDLIICDYSLPRFGALGALETLQQRGLDIPFIMVSGTVGEETAAAVMKAGAHDYLMKDKLARLVAAVERECRDARGRAEQRAADRVARESAALYRSLVETLPDGVGVVGLQGQFLLCNERLASMNGYAAGELVAWTQLQLVAPEEALGLLRSPGGVRNVELSMARKDGSRYPAEASATTILDEDQQPKAFIVVVRDVTDRKEMQARLILGDRMASIGTLAAGVAHEINNPLAYILANLESAGRQVTEHLEAGASLLTHPPQGLPARFLLSLADLEDCREALSEASEGAERVRDIVRDLKAVSRNDEGHRNPIDLQKVVESSIRMASNEIRHRARLVKNFAEAPVVQGSDGRLAQVFLNLLVNAAQAIPEGAAHQNEVKVTIRTDAQGRAVVDISDTGEGIPLEARARIFDPFFTTKPVGVGTGLGLSLCGGIVASLGGELTFESEVGRGTVFHVALPTSGDAVQPEAPTPVAATPCRRGRILVIDDEPMIGAAIRRSLSPRHEIVVFTSAREALSCLQSGQRFDLIFSDLMMPEMTGMEFYGELKRFAPEVAKSVIFLTGGAFTARAKRFFDEVPNLRLEKPFQVARLESVVNARLRAT